MARRLEGAGAAALAMPCNTAHHYAGAIKDAVGIPFLNMVDLSAAYVAGLKDAGTFVGMLASPAVRLTHLFDKALAAYDKKTLWPSDDDKMLRAIQHIKKEGPTEISVQILREASDELAERGAMVQLIACSEFSLLSPSLQNGAQRCIDTLDILVNEIVNTSATLAK